jgi:hypothetical protein
MNEQAMAQGGEMTTEVTIDPASAAGEHFELTLAKVGDDRGTIRIKLWRTDQDHRRDGPSKDDLIELYDIRASEDGSRITCKGEVVGPDPVVCCTIHAAEPQRPARVRVSINGTLGGMGDGTTDYLIGPVEHDKIKQFVLGVGFPRD